MANIATCDSDTPLSDTQHTDEADEDDSKPAEDVPDQECQANDDDDNSTQLEAESRIWEMLQPKRVTHPKAVRVPNGIQEAITPLEQQLSDLVRSFSIAINARQFDISQTPWCDNLDSRFAGVPSKTESAKKSGALDKAEYVQHLRRLVEKHPHYHIDVERIDCFKDPGQGLAQAFLNYDVRGVPPGVTRKSVAIFKLRRNAGNVWRCYNVQSADGMAGSEGGAGAGF